MFSIDGTGKLGKKLIFRKRKGIKDAKKYVVPDNPKTEGQSKQRNYLKDAVLQWKTEGYSILDYSAWGLYASLQKKNLSGYNMFLRERINAAKASKTWTKLTNCNVYDVTGEGFKVDIDVESDLSGILYLGTSKYSMLKEFEGIFSVNKYTFTVTGLLKETKYYFYIKNTSIGEKGRTGVYCKKTEIRIPIIVDIGCPAIDRPYYLTGPRTTINRGNPANATGIIKTIEIYADSDLSGCKVATFYVENGNKLTTRDYEEIGAVTAGSKQTFTVSLEVQEGDYIGMSYSNGVMERELYEEEGVWHESIDQIPCYNHEFAIGVTWAVSLYGIGKE